MTAVNKSKENISLMFDSIAGKYDLLNHILSFGIDKIWRKKVRKYFQENKHNKILDIATGTGDLAIELAKLKPTEIYGIDISEQMLDIAKQKAERKNINIKFQYADALNLEFEDDYFDALSCAFGVRNFENLEAGLKEMYRVLDKGGNLAILEFSKPQKTIIRELYFFYFKKILPFIGKKISKSTYAYTYLPESVSEFPYGKDFIQILNKIGFVQTSFRKLSFGIANLYYAKK
jgi:demethylmenaquinone methyltransferase/2-methoxy-6-polyprenyl-1,4-benzoquinol methylase